MAVFLVLIVADMKCSCLSVLLVYATRRTANCVALAILIGMYQLVNDIRASRGNAMRPYLQCYTAELQLHSSTSGTECHTVLVGSRVQLQETVSASTGSCGVSCLSSHPYFAYSPHLSDLSCRH